MPSAACRHGLVQAGDCAHSLHMHFEEARPAYFSWWNVVLMGVGLLLALLVYFPLNFLNGGAYLRTRHAWWVHYLVTPLIIASCAIAASLTLTSQALFADNYYHMIGGKGAHLPAEHTDAHAVSVQVPALQKFMQHNVLVHIIPGMVAVVVMLVLATGSLHGADVRTVVLATLLLCAVIWVAYFATPTVGFRDGKTYVGWSKIAFVYSNPNPSLVAGHCAFAIACALLIAYFVVRPGSPALELLQGGKNTAGTITAGTITAGTITAGTITAGTNAAGAITAGDTAGMLSLSHIAQLIRSERTSPPAHALAHDLRSLPL